MYPVPSTRHTLDGGQQIEHTANGWSIRLTRVAEIALFGTDWLPLPFTACATLATVSAHVNTLKGF